MKSIAVLTTVHNRKDITLKCLSALYSQHINVEYVLDVYLTDDGCTDGTLSAIHMQFPSVHVLEGNGNLFWNRGMIKAWNTASSSKEYDYYLWLNDDTFLLENALEVLLEGSKECYDKAIIVGTTQSVITQKITYGGRSKNDTLLTPNGVLQQCHHFNGNIVLIPKYVYNILGTLDPIFHHALGDFDYGLRAGKAQVRMYVSSDFVGHCEGHDSFPKWCHPQRSFKERCKVFYASSCDCNPKQFFAFESRHYGYSIAIFHWITLHIRLFFPRLWNLRKVY